MGGRAVLTQTGLLSVAARCSLLLPYVPRGGLYRESFTVVFLQSHPPQFLFLRPLVTHLRDLSIITHALFAACVTDSSLGQVTPPLWGQLGREHARTLRWVSMGSGGCFCFPSKWGHPCFCLIRAFQTQRTGSQLRSEAPITIPSPEFVTGLQGHSHLLSSHSRESGDHQPPLRQDLGWRARQGREQTSLCSCF